MFGNLGSLLVGLFAAGVLYSAVALGVAHMGSRRYLAVLGLLALALCATIIGSWLPASLPTSPVGRFLAGGAALLPSLAASSAIIAGTQWRLTPVRPWISLILGGLAFSVLAPVGLMLGMLVSDAFRR